MSERYHRLNDHHVRNLIQEDIATFEGKWPPDDEPVDVERLSTLVANLLRLTQILGTEIDELRAELRQHVDPGAERLL